MKTGLVGRGVSLVCLALTVAFNISEARAEKAIALKDLPSAVRTAAEKLTAGATLKKITKEREDGADAYSVEASIAGTIKEFTFAPDGTLLAEEEGVAFAQLPESVRSAAGKYFAGTDGLRASKELAKGVTSYEVEGKKSGHAMSVTFNAEGALLEEEKDKD